MATIERQPAPPTDAMPARPPPPRRGLAVGVLLGLAVVVLVAFPIAARIAAGDQPVPPPPPVALAPQAAGTPGPAVRSVPVLATATGAAGRLAPTPERADLERTATALLGPARGRELARLMGSRERTVGGPADVVGFTYGEVPPYPYRYRSLERILGALPGRPSAGQVQAATALGAQLLVGAARSDRHPNDAPIAFALLDRARAGGACAPQLDLLLVVAAQQAPVVSQARLEAQRARRVCPGDPTPAWLLGQLRFQTEDPAAAATFRRLQREFPRSAAGWSGEADVLLHRAGWAPPGRAFGARRLIREALARLQRAA
ncbi:MAG: hypothetical protein HZB46_18295, partial [Solirubrobacterales bacterium]|nr:hypothetical protein [Solirubrobacterales bacterium]